MELLFECRTNLGGFSGHLNFFQRRPEIHPEPVLRPDCFTDEKGVSIYGSVLRDGGTLRMWYHAIPADWDMRTDMASIAYAESEDGYRWTKPSLGIVEHGPGPNHLTDLGLHSATVFLDPTAPPSHRYRATGCGYSSLFLVNPGVTDYGYYTAHSSDGLRWTMDQSQPRWRAGDVITSIWHPGRGGGLTAMKYTPRWMRITRRSIHTAELRQGVYSDAVTALYPDEFDDVCAYSRGFHSCDYYGMGLLPAGRGTVGFLWNYWHELPYTGAGQVGLYGTSDVTLVYQPDPGGRWLHMPGRPIFLDHTSQPWMSGWINTASNVVEVGDEHRLYFSGRPTSHGYGWTPDWTPHSRWAEYMARHVRSGITFARWPQWRLFGFESDPEGGFTIDLGEIARPSEVVLNYEIKAPDGCITAELRGEGLQTRAREDCLPLTGDSTGEAVRWQSGSVIPPTPVAALALHLENARVYAYELRPL